MLGKVLVLLTVKPATVDSDSGHVGHFDPDQLGHEIQPLLDQFCLHVLGDCTIALVIHGASPFEAWSPEVNYYRLKAGSLD